MTVQGLIDELLEFEPEKEIDYLEVDLYGIVSISFTTEKSEYNV